MACGTAPGADSGAASGMASGAAGHRADGAAGPPADGAVRLPADGAGDPRAVSAPFALVGIALPGPGKPRTINAALRLSATLGYTGWLWTDDDVRFTEGCLERLVTRFRARGCTGAVGAAVVALARDTPAARTMAKVSSVTLPPGACPVAACMVVATEVIAPGIPARRLADDGHVLFELLDPAAPDPLHALEVLPDAQGLVHRPGRSRDTVRRLRRSLYSHATCMADYPRPVAAHYFSRILFHGLWPLAPFDHSRGTRRGLVRWAVKAVHFGWFCRVAAGLALRGAAGRPLHTVTWGDEGDFRSPVGGTAPG
ncbi:MoeGT5 [Streptomyces clavuligerus]|nr:MoeGT5 [Streptomyces clavuligerus]